MIDDKNLKEEFGEDLTKFMKWLYKDESLGVFDEELKLVKIEKLK